MYIIYLATNLIDGQRYIGRTSQLLHMRVGQYACAVRKGHAQRPLEYALQEFGFDAFRFRVLKTCGSEDELLVEEARLIASLRPEYNRKQGASGRRTFRHRHHRAERATRREVFDLPGEIWKAIPSTYGAYEASSEGRIRRAAHTFKSKYGIVRHPAQLMKATEHVNGTLRLALQVNGRKMSGGVHQFVAEAFLGPRPSGLGTLHENGIKKDNRSENLYYGTQKQNAADRDRHGTTARGNRAGNAKLSEASAREILALRGTMSQRAMGAKFGVSHTSIWQVLSGKNWVPQEEAK